MTEEVVASTQAFREQLEEQREALQEVEAALEHGEDAEMMQVGLHRQDRCQKCCNVNNSDIAKNHVDFEYCALSLP